MLVLTRRIGERLVINDNIWVKILSVKGRQVLIGIDAPEDISVHREEVKTMIDAEGTHKCNKDWRKKLQVYDMMTNRYSFDILDGSLHCMSQDGNHECGITMTTHDRLNLFINLTRLLETVSKGEYID